MPVLFSAVAIVIATVPALSAQQIDVAQRQQEVCARETAFAKSMADRDLAAFASFISGPIANEDR